MRTGSRIRAVLGVLLIAVPACTTVPSPDSTAEEGVGATTPVLIDDEESPDSGRSVDPESSQDDNEPESLPIALAIEQISGFSEVAVAEAVNNARFDHIVACMTERGWDYGYDDLPPAGATQEPVSVLGNQIEWYLAELDRASAEEGTDGVNPEQNASSAKDSLEFESEQFECWQSSEERFPDPLMPLWNWIGEETAAINAWVKQDERVTEAHKAAQRCMAEGGYRSASIEEAVNHINDAASDVWKQYRDGSIGEEQTRTELTEAAVEAAEFNDHAMGCLVAEAQVEGTVRAEYEAEFVEENGDRIALAAAEYVERLDPYTKYLEDLVK